MPPNRDPDEDTQEYEPLDVPAPPAARPAPPEPAPLPTRKPETDSAGWHQAPPANWSQAASSYPTNPLVVTAAIVLLVYGLLVTLAGVLGIVAAMFVTTLAEQLLGMGVIGRLDLGTLTTILLVAFGTVLVVGLLHLLSALGIFMHKGWARAIGLLLATLGTLAGAAGIVAAGQDLLAGYELGRLASTPVVITVGYAWALFALMVGGNHFRRRYRR